MLNIKIDGGATRSVILIWKYAIKIPRLNYGWQLFLKGLLGNMQETLFSGMKDDRMCPILFSLPGGFLNVMPRCEQLTKEQFKSMNIDYFWSQKFKIVDGHTIYYGDCTVPVEHKIDSFGLYKGNIVAIDYGS